MSEHERIRRPEPERTGPIRGGTFDLFGTPPTPDADGAARDPVARAVDLGYRVVDDYMRQGQQAARLLGKRAYTPEAFANDLQEMTAGLLQYGAELMELWVGIFGQLADAPGAGPGGAASPTGEHPEPGKTGEPGRSRPGPASSSPPRPANVALAIRSPFRTEVTVSLAASSGAALSVQPLQNAAGDQTLTGATLHGDDPPRLELEVPADARAGRYYGLVLDDASRLPVGTVVVEIHADEPAA